MVGPCRRVLVVVLLAGLAACQRNPVLVPIGGIDALQEQFNADAGQPRIILLLSPT